MAQLKVTLGSPNTSRTKVIVLLSNNSAGSCKDSRVHLSEKDEKTIVKPYWHHMAMI